MGRSRKRRVRTVNVARGMGWAALVVVAAGARPGPDLPGASDDAARCSLREFFGWRQSGSEYVLATAAADTLHAGPGSVEYLARGDDPGSFHGQRFTVERSIGGVAGPGEAVLVPWSYEAACRTTPWEGSARWVVPGATVFRSSDGAEPPACSTPGRATGWGTSTYRGPIRGVL